MIRLVVGQFGFKNYNLAIPLIHRVGICDASPLACWAYHASLFEQDSPNMSHCLSKQPLSLGCSLNILNNRLFCFHYE